MILPLTTALRTIIITVPIIIRTIIITIIRFFRGIIIRPIILIIIPIAIRIITGGAGGIVPRIMTATLTTDIAVSSEETEMQVTWVRENILPRIARAQELRTANQFPHAEDLAQREEVVHFLLRHDTGKNNSAPALAGRS